MEKRALGAPSIRAAVFLPTPSASSGVENLDARQRIKELERENASCAGANEILKAASVFFAGELDPHRPK